MPELYKPWGVKNELGDLWGVEITEGTFNGVVISINDVTMSEESNDVVLDYTAIKKPEDMSDDALQTDEFKQVIEQVLNDILKKAIELYEHREVDTSESNTQ